jgi:hypothetical protein
MKQAGALTPVMLPFGLLPVVPNFPFLIAAWRCFSHYRAWKGAEWLLRLIKEGNIQVRVDEKLKDALMSTTSADTARIEDVNAGKEAEDRAPDETSTPPSAVFHANEQFGVKGENAVRITEDLLNGESPSPADHKDTSVSNGEKSGNSTVPDPKDEDVAPDATGTPSSLIYKPTTESTESSTEPIVLLENLPKLAETFGLSASEVVDITRAVVQIKEKAEKAAKEAVRADVK